MGSGGRMTAKERKPHRSHSVKDDPVRRVPHLKPPFTVGQLKKVIPPHCFQRSALRSLSYVALDLTVSSILLYTAIAFIPTVPSVALRLASWVIYWAAQGCVFTGVSVIAHECGHHAFTDNSLLGDMVGLVLHSALLVPYFSFKYSHRHHHSNTGSLDRDELYVPKPRSALPSYAPLINNPIGRCISIFVTLALGLPIYFAFNCNGRKYPRFACHYDPYSPIYSDRERVQVLISDMGVASAAFVLFKLAAAMGFWWVVRVYGAPLFLAYGWIALITFLQHTHPALPHYDSSEWEWLRGALSTVDRDVGLLNHVFHHLTDTHVAHHLFSAIPHYHAEEATRAIRPLLGEYYRMDRTPLAKAMWREVRECLCVEPDEGAGKSKGVFWYRNKL